MNCETLNYSKKITIYDKADIIVMGGGPAGVAAAVCLEDKTTARNANYKKIREYIDIL